MKKRLVVRKEKFDSLMTRILQAKPVPRNKIKTSGKRGSKPILPNQP